MNCTQHQKNQVSIICIAPHKCEYQRKLCVECQYKHGVDQQYTVPINIFQEQVVNKLQEYKLNEITEQKSNFKQIISQTENLMKKVWEELSESIKQIYDLIEKKNNSYSNLIDQNINLAETSYSDLEQIVLILQGKNLDNWIDEKDCYLKKLQEEQQWWEQECKSLKEKSEKVISSSIKPIYERLQIYDRKDNFYEVLTLIKNIDESFLNEILDGLKKLKITDCLEYLSNINNQEQRKKKFIIGLIKIISEIDFNKLDYFSIQNEQIRKDFIQNISQDNEHIIEFLKFLVHLTVYDERFIQCGSISANILVELKTDLSKQSFENIRIRDTSLIGGNFAECNFNGSNFYNVDISGMDLTKAQLESCIWKNIKIHELNKLDSHSDFVRSVCLSSDGTIIASGDDNSIRLWDVKTGQQKVQLDVHQYFVKSVKFSPHGTTLASGSWDSSIRLWDADKGMEVQLTDNRYREILASFNMHIKLNSFLQSTNSNITIILISQTPHLQAQGAFFLQGQYHTSLN